MRTIVVGDIHGCYNELSDLILKLNLTPEDRFISVGDIIHKGPDEHNSILCYFAYGEEYALGNHEEKQFRWEKHEDRRIEMGKKNPMSNVEDYVRLHKSNLEDLTNFARLFIQFVVNDKKFIVVHGGIPRSIKTLPASNIPDFKTKSYFDLLRTRYENPKGYMVELGKETDADNYWADLYDGRFGYAIFGHQPFFEDDHAVKFPHALGIDLGVVYGNKLCAAVVDDQGNVTEVTVPARQKYTNHRDE